MSTGEDTPEGHSVRGRMIVREIQPGDVEASKLSAAQANRPLYAGTMHWLAVQFAAEGPNVKARAQQMRDELIDIGHSRTPSTLGHMIAVCEDFLIRCEQAKFITPKERKKLDAEMATAIVAAGREQAEFLEATDPVAVFFTTLKQMFAAGTHHVRSTTGGIPRGAAQLGWTVETGEGEIPRYKARGATIGWCSASKGQLFLDPHVAVVAVKKVAGAEIPLSKGTLIKRMHEGGKLLSREDARGRYTKRVTLDGAYRNVLVVDLKEVIEAPGNAVDEAE